MFRLVCGTATPHLLALATAVGIVATGIHPLDANRERVDPEKEPKAGEERKFEIAKDVFMEFCWIPSGETQLGSPKEEQDYITKTFDEGKRLDFLDNETEAKRGKFKTKGFWLGKYTVTQAQWKAVMGNNPSFFNETRLRSVKGIDTNRFPVEDVSWDDCQKFLDTINKRDGMEKAFGKAGRFMLPHEDQWEYACRGGKGNKQAFYFGNELNGTQANCNGERPYGTDKKGDYKFRTTEVGSYAKDWPHPWNLCDMHGNVCQWCENKFEQTSNRVLRGGSWFHTADTCRSAYRLSYEPDYHSLDFGLRVCFPLEK